MNESAGFRARFVQAARILGQMRWGGASFALPCFDLFTFVYSGVDVDWRHGADHMLQRHGVRVNEVDPKGRSGSSARLLGYCPSRGQVLVIILVAREDKLGAWWGATGWVATNADRGRYRRENENE